MRAPKLVDFAALGEEALLALYRDHTIVETSSAALDPDRQMLSASPFIGDYGSSFLFVPQTPTLLIEERYLFRLAAFGVPPNGRAKILGLRTHITIAQQTLVQDGELESWRFVNEFPVVTPGWSFSDANVSWHLRVLRGPALDQRSGLVLPPGMSGSLYGIDSSLLVETLVPRYVAPNGGLPPGSAVGSLGTFRDQRFPWNRQGAKTDLGFEVDGPAIVALYASVWQTDPETRPYLPVAQAPVDVGALCPEDRFVLAFGDPGLIGGQGNQVRYRHVGGAIVAELSNKLRSEMTPLCKTRIAAVPSDGSDTGSRCS